MTDIEENKLIRRLFHFKYICSKKNYSRTVTRIQLRLNRESPPQYQLWKRSYKPIGLNHCTNANISCEHWFLSWLFRFQLSSLITCLKNQR